MSTTFVSQNIWSQLTKAVSDSRKPCAVAVAYFGAGASRLLPLVRNSRLVVDASERAVASGQTCPADLITLVERGIAVYSVPNLHAKVFALGNAAFIGSTNVSGRSASQLVEAVVRTTEPAAVRAARQFIHDLCLHELTPTVLRRLAKLYRPPLIPGGKRGKKRAKDTFRRPTLPPLRLVQLKLGEWSESEQALHDTALPIAKKRRQHPRTYELDSFRWTGKCACQRGDLIIQVTNEGGGRVLVTPPGNVLHVRTRLEGKRQVSFVYLERPSQRRRTLKALAQSLGQGSLKRLTKGGLIRDAAFSQALLNAWTK